MNRRLLVAISAAAALVAQNAPPRIPPGVYIDVAQANGRHVLARDRGESAVAQGLREQRTYTAQAELGDPAGFAFVAGNNNGVYDIGDHAPFLPRTRLVAQTPVAASLRILRDNVPVAEAKGTQVEFTATEPGAYRVEAKLGDKVWIESGAIVLERVENRGLSMPSLEIAPSVDVQKDISYVEGREADAAKHKLDLYLPKEKKGFPVLLFIHGGAWRSGDRALYPPLGNRFAKEGIGVVVPSYRLMPGAPHPAQIEDAISMVDWVIGNVARYGGDPKRIYLAGHSAGGHLAAYAGLERRFWPNLKAVLALSGVYDVSELPAFQGGSVDGSPIHRISAGAPPFLITYCQNDYPGLPEQARRFDAALRKAGIQSDLVYIPGKNHISEMVDIWRDDDPTARAVLRTINGK